MTAVDETLPEDHEPPSERRRLHVAWMITLPVLILIGLAAIGAAFLEIPYYTVAPGSVRSTGELIVVDENGSEFPSDGDVLFTTVSVRGRITPWGALAGWLDPAVEVVEEDQVLRGRTPTENRQVNLQLMDSSKSTAVQVAFEELGFEVATPINAVITDVQAGSPSAGELERGDVIVGVDGEPVVTSSEVVAAITSLAPGDTVILTVRRFEDDQDDQAEALASEDVAPIDLEDPELQTVEIVLGERPDDPSLGFLGVGVQTRNRLDFPFEVDISSGSVGGPSAGLAFTLGVIDVLTPGELTGGDEVAVTGTIQAGGAVGPIGGVAQKAAAVRRAGIEVFIVPSSLQPEEIELARALAGDDVELVEVATLEEALDVLAERGGNADDLDASGLAAGDDDGT